MADVIRDSADVTLVLRDQPAVRLVIPAVPVGPAGPQGPPGAQGIQGIKGDTGQQGIQGIQGLKGDKGDQGNQGIQGIQGVKGDTGQQGIQGVKGDTGAAPTTIPQAFTVASHVLTLANAGQLIEINSASGQTLTVPPNSSVAFPQGTVISFRQYGTAQITITPGAGVVLRSRGGALKTAAQYSEGTLTKRDVGDEWIVSGDLVP